MITLYPATHSTGCATIGIAVSGIEQFWCAHTSLSCVGGGDVSRSQSGIKAGNVSGQSVLANSPFKPSNATELVRVGALSSVVFQADDIIVIWLSWSNTIPQSLDARDSSYLLFSYLKNLHKRREPSTH
jgi:hypothetical protein